MIEKRRESRFACDLPVSVVLREGFEGPVVAGPAPGQLHDLSSYGASLIVPQIRFGKHHLFYSSRDHHPTQILFIQVDLEEEEPLMVPVRPIGFDRVLFDEAMPFQIGVEFIKDTGHLVARLMKLSRERRRERNTWWRKLLRKVWPPYEEDER